MRKLSIRKLCTIPPLALVVGAFGSGALYADPIQYGSATNSVAGSDGNLRTSSFIEADSLNFSGRVIASMPANFSESGSSDAAAQTNSLAPQLPSQDAAAVSAPVTPTNSIPLDPLADIGPPKMAKPVTVTDATGKTVTNATGIRFGLIPNPAPGQSGDSNKAAAVREQDVVGTPKATPEPGTLCLMVLSGLALLRRKRLR